MKNKRVRTITLLFSKKNRNSQITNKNETQRKKGKRTKKRKMNEKKKNERKKEKCNNNILKMYEKVYSFSIKYHDNVVFLKVFSFFS